MGSGRFARRGREASTVPRSVSAAGLVLEYVGAGVVDLVLAFAVPEGRAACMLTTFEAMLACWIAASMESEYPPDTSVPKPT